MSGNRLADESSPYLLQHADNPVNWYPWGDEAFARARADNRPVLLSIGYSACHWCHVMAHECFENPAIAAHINRLFVAIKVDREERPDVDSIYMQAVQAMSGNGGWPLTVFLTPSGRPFFGGTYFPPADRPGMSGLPTVMDAVAEAYAERPDEIANVTAEMQRLLAAHRIPEPADLDRSQIDAAAVRLIDNIDWEAGGFGGAPKFPHPAATELLLRRWHTDADPRAWDAASVTLDGMARGGLFDQLAGGFHRYSVDADWAVPHFEKMLYDNAQLAPLYVHAHQLSGRQRWRRIAEATLDYMITELRLPNGAFAASQDADTSAGEGASFTWTPEQIAAILSRDDAELACRVFGVTAEGNTEGAATVLSLPTPLDDLARSLGVVAEELETHVDGIRRRLLAARRERPQPGRDDKVICSWNALAISALAGAGAALRRSDYIAAARECSDMLLSHLVVDGVVQRTWRDGTARIVGFLEDVAYLGDALLTLYEATGQVRYYDRALELARSIEPRFGDGRGGLYDTAADAEPLIVRPRTIEDNPIPSGASISARLWLRLHRFTGDDSLRERALAILRPLGGIIARSPLSLSAAACALDFELGGWRQIAIAGDPAASDTEALVAAAWSRFEPGRTLAWGDAPDLPLLEQRELRDGRATAYVCEHFQCLTPTTDPDQLRTQLDALRA